MNAASSQTSLPFACKELWSASLSCSEHFCVRKGLGLKDFFSSMSMQSDWSWRLSLELGKKHLEPKLWIKKPGRPEACCGLFARLSCRQWLFWHKNTNLWVLSPSSKSPGTHRCLPLAHLQPQTFLLPFPVPGTPCCSYRQPNMDWRLLKVLELKQVTSMRLRCCQALFNFHLGPSPSAPGAGPAFSAT